MAFFRQSGTVLLCGLVLGGAVQADEVVLALLHKSEKRRHSPYPRRIYATGTVTGRPICVKRLSKATRTCSSTT